MQWKQFSREERVLEPVDQRPGHKKGLNKPYVERFIKWITELKEQKNKVNAQSFGLLFLNG
jgi:chorismate mutase